MVMSNRKEEAHKAGYSDLPLSFHVLYFYGYRRISDCIYCDGNEAEGWFKRIGVSLGFDFLI